MSYLTHTWGDLVRVSANAPEIFRPGQRGEVCGIWTIKTEENADARGESVGTTIYTVEFGDGTSVEIPDRYLEKET